MKEEKNMSNQLYVGTQIQLKTYSRRSRLILITFLGPYGLIIVSNVKFCADSKNVRLKNESWSIREIRAVL